MAHADRFRRGGKQVIARPDIWEPGPVAGWCGLDGFAPDVAQLADASQSLTAAVLPFGEHVRQSAVLMVLHQHPVHGAEVLVTRRAEHLRNHAGEMSFPGGRLDPGEGYVDAALREAREEVALDGGVVVVCGEAVHVDYRRFGGYIVPVVATVEHRPVLVANPDEVARVMWVPLAELVAPGVHHAERWFSPFERTIHYFPLADETIWGITAEVLVGMLERAVITSASA